MTRAPVRPRPARAARRARRMGRPRARGIALAEALVALAVAAMTMLLLSSAGWGLRHAMDRQAAAAQPAAAEWLATRRVLRDFASGLTMSRDGEAAQRVLGSEKALRMGLAGAPAGHPAGAVVELRIREAEGVRTLTVTRQPGRSDPRVAGADLREAELMRTEAPLRFAYLVAGSGLAAGATWRTETHPADLPVAIAVMAGEATLAVAPVPSEVSVACVAAVGIGGLEEPRCRLR